MRSFRSTRAFGPSRISIRLRNTSDGSGRARRRQPDLELALQLIRVVGRSLAGKAFAKIGRRQPTLERPILEQRDGWRVKFVRGMGEHTVRKVVGPYDTTKAGHLKGLRHAHDGQLDGPCELEVERAEPVRYRGLVLEVSGRRGAAFFVATPHPLPGHHPAQEEARVASGPFQVIIAL